MRPLAAALLAIATLLVGCGQDPGTGSDEGSAGPTGDWVLASGFGPGGRNVPMIEGSPITMTITGDRIGGTAACNGYGGSVAISGVRLQIGDLARTEMGCEPDVAASEDSFLGALGMVTGFERTGDALTLGGPDVRLHFALVPPVADAPLVGTTWVLDTIVIGEGAGSVQGEATLVLAADGTLTGMTGCRALTARYEMAGDELQVTDMRTQGDCTAGVEAQDEHVLGVLGDRFTAVVDEDSLTLSSSDDRGLIYRAAPGIE
jgi:heat shock protein HslJ